MTAASSIPETLVALADLAEIRGLTASAADLRRGAAALEALDPTGAAGLEERARRDQLANEPGMTPAVAAALREVAQGGSEMALRAARAGIPMLLRRLLDIAVISPAEGLSLVRQAGILTFQDLTGALDDGRVRSVLGEALDERLRQAAALIGDSQPMTLGRAWDVLDPLIAAMAETAPGVEAVLPSGDMRRVEPLVSALVLVAGATDPPAAVEWLCAQRGLHVLHRSPRRAIVLFAQTEVDVRFAAADEYGTVLFRTTGSRAHLAAVRQRRALPLLAAREADVYRHVGLQYIPPELRHADGEIEAAAANRLPALVDREHIRGDLHMHSTYSDGRDTLADMVAACSALGYEYVAITDHSESAAASRTVSIDQLERQRDEIARLREQYPRLTILHGIEADILQDGRLDFPDAVLESLDIVLASLHDPGRHDGRTLTERCIRAIRHPLVNVITHPANQLVGRRGGYELDFDAVYAAAAETGTALEIDGAPSHLDLDGAHARRAVAAGVTVTIDSDCHRAQALDRQMRLGVGTARRGWVEPRHVLNTRPLSEVRAFIAAKRGRS